MRVELGVLPSGDKAYFDLDAPAHMAVCGVTRSGKSSFIYSLISSLAHCYPNVRINIIDPSCVIGMAVSRHPVSGLVLTGADSSGALDVVTHVLDEMSMRVDNLWDKRTDKFSRADFPLEVLLIEELPGLLDIIGDDDNVHGRKANEKVAPKIVSGLRKILMMGLKVGVVLILVAQRFDANLLTGAGRANILVKVCLRAEDSHSILMLLPYCSMEKVAEMRSAPPGRALISMPGIEGESFIRLNWLSYDEYLYELGV